MNFSEELLKAMSPNPLIEFKLFGMSITITDTIVLMWFVMLLIFAFVMIVARNLKEVPDGRQNVAEMFVEFVQKFAHDNMGHNGKYFVSYLGSILLFLVFANIVSIFNVIPIGNALAAITGNHNFNELAIRPPTRDVNLTVTMALISILTVLFSSIRIRGFKGWLHYHIEPVPIILPFKILDYFIRPLSLSMRLFGNILGAFIVMELLYFALPLVLPAAFSIYFDLFDGMLQAYVFVFLTSLYIAEAIEE